MEDIYKFLLVAGIIIIGFIRQAKKEAKRKADNDPTMPMPEMENPLPESWGGGTYGGYIPEGPQPNAAVTFEKKGKQKPFKAKSATPKNNTAKEPSHYTADSLQQNFTSIPVIQDTDEASEFQINSAEEARRAIIWSEILQRKY